MNLNKSQKAILLAFIIITLVNLFIHVGIVVDSQVTKNNQQKIVDGARAFVYYYCQNDIVFYQGNEQLKNITWLYNDSLYNIT